jgi:hypothetical protein
MEKLKKILMVSVLTLGLIAGITFAGAPALAGDVCDPTIWTDCN